ncbi:MAG: hypothetical protein ABUL60_24015 [Myxococcales bacterium]
METCRYCDAEILKKGYDEKTRPTGRSEEHGVPRWLLNLLDIRFETTTEVMVGPVDADLAVGHVDAPTAHTTKVSRTLVNDRRVLGETCRSCNGGWMNQLELAVRDAILTPLILGSRSVKNLSQEELATLARWTLKTASVLSESDTGAKVVPNEHGRWVRNEQGIPTGCVFICTSLNEPLFMKKRTYLGRFWQLLDRAPELTDESLRAGGQYKAALGFGRVLLMIAYWPHPGWMFAPVSGLHEVHWPPEVPVKMLPTMIGFPDHMKLQPFAGALCATSDENWTSELVKTEGPPAGVVFEHDAALLAWHRSLMAQLLPVKAESDGGDEA